jgi:hypothetical protein
MSSRSRIRAGRSLAATLVATVVLGGCSDIYYDRRETVALGADDAVASNRVTHMVDPWPRHSANKNIAFNGERMQKASENYRLDKVKPPVGATTSSVLYQQQMQQGVTTMTTSVPTITGAPVAAVK